LVESSFGPGGGFEEDNRSEDSSSEPSSGRVGIALDEVDAARRPEADLVGKDVEGTDSDDAEAGGGGIVNDAELEVDVGGA
jgi:hypothetical protein